MMKAQQQKQPSFLNRLVGTEDDQLESICSPYTARYVYMSVCLLSRGVEMAKFGSCPGTSKWVGTMSWVKVFRIIHEFRILRLTFHRKSASKC